MAGARRLLAERGYARITSRDLAAAAEAPLGTINYHYGSKEALLNAALLETLREWGDRTMPPAEPTAGDDAERLDRMWSRIIASVSADRPMLLAAVEAYAQAERSPDIRRQIAEALEASRPRMARELHDLDAETDPDVDERTARAVGSVHMALTTGLIHQWLVDPERAPDAAELALGLRAIAHRLETAGR
ncbi:TetR/AcrR family transcriptional regulator [Streptomyces hainanensis]|uniref:TetR/AcrR family transcriptional regulator n=2 Tax=Streptomyces hainanensis TaxID=402648 RepID=A0A4R4TQE8_9ACTN|nr:TetR/AcrR family transcriptional regulator [Streptomyces hainanensis]